MVTKSITTEKIRAVAKLVIGKKVSDALFHGISKTETSLSTFYRQILDNIDCLNLLTYETTLTDNEKDLAIINHDRMQRSLGSIYTLDNVQGARKVPIISFNWLVFN